MKTEPNFVDKLCAEITFSGKYVVKLKPETKLYVKICFAWQSELCVEFYKFRKYYTVYNSGLKIWLLSDFPTENPLLNGMFCYICNGLVLHLRHNFKPRNVVCNIFSELTLTAFPLVFSERNLLKLLTKNLA